ncbi:MAG: methionine biosynthesis protein MetW [Deltaproteobacteria bacterium]|jgi:methionine biosynthesis protein MetW|nr:methionine biosynthesis protein MetW [Deltaproteobacteria bacterium]
MVIVLDKNSTPLMPCSGRKARMLIRKGRASLVARTPFTIMLKDKEVRDAPSAEFQLRMDDGVREEFERLKSLHRRLGLYPGAGSRSVAGPHPSGGADGGAGWTEGALPAGDGAEDGAAASPAGAAASLSGGGDASAAPAGAASSSGSGDASAAPTGGRWQDRVILSAVEPGAYVLDLGCGRGELLARLTDELGVRGQGVEVDPDAAIAAMEAGVPVLNVDLSLVLGDFADGSFDYVILESTLQTLQKPLEVIFEMLRVGRRGIVSFPNFGHWRVRLDLAARGRMPVTPDLPYGWHDTPNIHLFTLDDMLDVCEASDLKIVAAWGLCEGSIREVGPQDNLVTEEAILFLEKREAAGADSGTSGRR